MSRTRLTFSGWMAMLSAVLAAPWYFVSSLAEEGGSAGAVYAEAFLLIAGTLLFVYLISSFKSLLNSRLHFHRTDSSIRLLIIGNVLIAAVGLLGLFPNPLQHSVVPVVVVLSVLLGLLQMRFGIQLLSLPYNLKGLQRPYCYLNIATGLCQAFIILMPVGLVTSAVADVMLGTIFFHAAVGTKKETS